MVATAVLDRLWKPPKVSIDDLVRDHYDDVYRFCARRVGEAAAADLTQETFLDAQRGIRGFRGDSSPRTWVLGIALNRTRKWAQQRKVGALRVELREDLVGIASHEGQLVDREALQRALDSLTDEHREAVWLCVIEQLSTSEAAQALGIPQGTVKSRLHYAFAHLRTVLTHEVTR